MHLRLLVVTAMAITLLFVQEQALTFIPNVQLSTMLIVLYTTLFSFRRMTAIIFVHVLLDNIYMGSMHPLYTPAMFIAWMIIPIAWHTVLRRSVCEKRLALFGIVFGFLYGMTFIPFRMIEFGVHIFWPYFLADLPFEIIMAASNFVTIYWLYGPLRQVLRREMASLFSQEGFSPQQL